MEALMGVKNTERKCIDRFVCMDCSISSSSMYCIVL